MTTKIQDILQRIEKLKNALYEKNRLIEEQDLQIEEFRGKIAALEDFVRSHEETTAKLKAQMQQESAQRTEAYSLASHVEAMTKAQKQIYQLRERVRELERGGVVSTAANAESHSGPKSVAEDPNVTVGAVLAVGTELEDLMAVVNEQQIQIQTLEERLAAQGGKADEATDSDAVILAMQEQIVETEEKQRELEAALRQEKRRGDELSRDIEEKDAVILEQIAQLAGEE